VSFEHVQQYFYTVTVFSLGFSVIGLCYDFHGGPSLRAPSVGLIHFEDYKFRGHPVYSIACEVWTHGPSQEDWACCLSSGLIVDFQFSGHLHAV
jgi:hypothetical protein